MLTRPKNLSKEPASVGSSIWRRITLLRERKDDVSVLIVLLGSDDRFMCSDNGKRARKLYSDRGPSFVMGIVELIIVEYRKMDNGP